MEEQLQLMLVANGWPLIEAVWLAQTGCAIQKGCCGSAALWGRELVLLQAVHHSRVATSSPCSQQCQRIPPEP